ncbi:hypothetical protein [Acinetobacter baumannii]|uniref:hypothetical protein n=1 Tax=Acinetobacter baumannii TaxID=470 RepID=UPI0021BF9BBB|nr:hypothetical protein [Acinetobacter baumannii]
MNNNTYTKSQVISGGSFYGVLLNDETYRESNLNSLNTWIANAIKGGEINVFKYEVFDLCDVEELTPMIRDLSKDKVMWARSFIGQRWLICIMTNKGRDYADGYLNAYSNDFNLLTEACLKTDADEELLQDIYSMVKHQQTKHYDREFATSGIKDKGLRVHIQKQSVIRKS